LHSFQGGNDGGNPMGGVIFGPDGYLYGATGWGGSRGGGTFFSLNHPWLGPFGLSGNDQGGLPPGPWAGPVVDPNGATNCWGPPCIFYGTSYADGASAQGSVFTVSVNCACGGCLWGYQDLYDFTRRSDGANPTGGLVL